MSCRRCVECVARVCAKCEGRQVTCQCVSERVCGDKGVAARGPHAPLSKGHFADWTVLVVV